jgi:hypothetical protein
MWSPDAAQAIEDDKNEAALRISRLPFRQTSPGMPPPTFQEQQTQRGGQPLRPLAPPQPKQGSSNIESLKTNRWNLRAHDANHQVLFQ